MKIDGLVLDALGKEAEAEIDEMDAVFENHVACREVAVDDVLIVEQGDAPPDLPAKRDGVFLFKHILQDRAFKKLHLDPRAFVCPDQPERWKADFFQGFEDLGLSPSPKLPQLLVDFLEPVRFGDTILNQRIPRPDEFRFGALGDELHT